MVDPEFLNAVKTMRELERAYFHSRSQRTLEELRLATRKVDRMIAAEEKLQQERSIQFFRTVQKR